MRSHDYWVYTLTNRRCNALYIGMTNNIARRLWKHRYGEVEGCAKRYHLNRLVWVEHFRNVNDAIGCEKKLKGWRRARKIAVIEKVNRGGSISASNGNSSQSSTITRGRRER